MKEKEINQEDDILIQSFITVEFLAELHNNNFLDSKYFNELNVQDGNIKTILAQIGIDNQGFFLMALYALLVIPKQFLKIRFPDDFDALNKYIHSIQMSSLSTYKNEERIDKIDFIRHIRNAVAHGRVEFTPTISVTFSDKDIDKNGKLRFSCDITIPLNQTGNFISRLQNIFVKYFNQKTNLSCS